MPDRLFTEPRLAELYDAFDGDRRDLDAYLATALALQARTVLDIGCGTGCFARRLAAAGIDVVALDPALASLDVARRKPMADRVTWVHGDVRALPRLQVDLVTMTGNVAQVFVSDTEWLGVLRASYDALRPGGALVFETRDPAARAWRAWTRDGTWQRSVVEGVGPVQNWVEVTAEREGMVTFVSSYVFERDDVTLTSESTLRFRDRDEVTSALAAAGFTDVVVGVAPDRPGLELVFTGTRSS